MGLEPMSTFSEHESRVEHFMKGFGADADRFPVSAKTQEESPPPDPHDVRFSRSAPIATVRYPHPGRGTVIAFDERTRGQVGHLVTDTAPFRTEDYVLEVSTDPEYRRQGIASQMWKHASENTDLRHAIPRERTDAGDSWAKSIGGRDVEGRDVRKQRRPSRLT